MDQLLTYQKHHLSDVVPGTDLSILRPVTAAPNPFNPQMTNRYELISDGLVNLEIYDVAGRKVRSLEVGAQSAGAHKVTLGAVVCPLTDKRHWLCHKLRAS